MGKSIIFGMHGDIGKETADGHFLKSMYRRNVFSMMGL